MTGEKVEESQDAIITESKSLRKLLVALEQIERIEKLSENDVKGVSFVDPTKEGSSSTFKFNLQGTDKASLEAATTIIRNAVKEYVKINKVILLRNIQKKAAELAG